MRVDELWTRSLYYFTCLLYYQRTHASNVQQKTPWIIMSIQDVFL